jgi:hypothetical protein
MTTIGGRGFFFRRLLDLQGESALESEEDSSTFYEATVLLNIAGKE